MHSRYYISVLLLLAFQASLRCQIINTWEVTSGGVVTCVEEGGVKEDDYAAQGIFLDWNDILGDFENTADNGELEREISEITAHGVTRSSRGFKDANGFSLVLPQIIAEDGTDLFYLTTDGINIFMAEAAPAFYQDVDDDVIKWIRFYAYQKKEYTRRLFRRYKDWEPRIRSYFESVGVPGELAELCLIESGCNYSAKSKVGALGMWQIMPETGRDYGMTVNNSRDDRLDPVLSTQVAARILRNNYRKVGEWTLAVAGYNCGIGRFKAGQQWGQIKSFLPKETQQYIPGLLAIHYVWTYRKELGLI